MKILAGLATTNNSYITDGKIVKCGPDKRFIETLPSFFFDCGRNLPDVQLDTMWVWNKELVDAQNDFAERVLEGGYDYLLTIEDDHWDFTAKMLQSCLDANTHICGIAYRSRHFPFDVVPMKFAKVDNQGIKRFSGMNDETLRGYHNADLLGFGFTLIKSEVFKILDRPFFRLNIDTYKGVGPRATDIDFCDRLIGHGIQPVGCFDHRLNHRDIREENYKQMLVEGILTQHSMFTTIESIGRHKKVQDSYNRNKQENIALQKGEENA